MIKINKVFFKENKKDIYFFLVGITLLIVIISAFVVSISFLLKSAENALDVGSSKNQPTRFNLDALKNIGILKGDILLSPSPNQTIPPNQNNSSTSSQKIIQ